MEGQARSIKTTYRRADITVTFLPTIVDMGQTADVIDELRRIGFDRAESRLRVQNALKIRLSKVY